MMFCSKCDNILIPNKKKLYCKACDEFFVIQKEDAKEYVIVKNMSRENADILPIVIKNGLKSTKISPQDRKAHEEFFGKGEQSGY